jgi:protein-S-isoprenylcysteine O-methyltransferase Ste14
MVPGATGTSIESASPTPAETVTAAPPRRSWAVAVGNQLFHYRNVLFPVSFVVIALASRPRWWGGDARADAIMDAVGLAISLAGQLLRAAVIGLVYIIRGGKDRRIYADALVTEGFFAHSRNPLYVGNMLVYLGLFIVLNSVLGYAVGVPFFFAAYWCITLAEEDFLRRQFGAAFDDYYRRVPRFIPKLRGLGQTMRGTRFHWKRLVRKEYGATFSWITTALALLYWESVRNQGVSASQGRLRFVLIVWAIVGVGYLGVRFLKKTKRLQD